MDDGTTTAGAAPKSLSERTNAQYRGEGEATLVARPPLPNNMMVELSNACNHACVFCPNPHMERKKGRIDKGLLERIIAEAAANGVKEVGFYTTGDPFIHKGLAHFTAAAKQAGMEYVYISTNGALATPKRAEAVIDAGMDSIKFSINAGSRDTYRQIHGKDDWDKVVAHLRHMADYRKTRAPHLRLYITCVVTRPMEHEVDAIRDMFTPIVDEVWFDPCTPLAWPDQSQHGNPGLCHMPFNRLHVTYEGYLTLCCVDFQNYLAVADLNELPLMEAWHAPAFVDIRRRHIEDRLTGTLCGRCWRGDPAPIEPLNEDYADMLDHDAYERDQRQRVLEQLRLHGDGTV